MAKAHVGLTMGIQMGQLFGPVSISASKSLGLSKLYLSALLSLLVCLTPLNTDFLSILLYMT